MNNSSDEIMEKYLAEGKISSTKAHQLVQLYRSAENLEKRMNISTALSVLALAYLLDEPSLAAKALSIAKLKKKG